MNNKIQRISTHWRGSYEYDPDPDAEMDLPVVEFELSFEFGWFGRFRGTIVEDSNGIPDVAEIRGKAKDDEIQFKKKYSCLWLTNELGESESLPDYPSVTIHYQGKIIESQARMEGSWEIPAEKMITDEYDWDTPATTGSWSASAVRANS